MAGLSEGIAKRQGRSTGRASLDAQGYHAGKKVIGRKRHIPVDTPGLLLGMGVCPPTFRIAKAPAGCCKTRGGAFPLSRKSPPTEVIRDR